MYRFFTGLWRHPEFMKLWISQTLSELGSQVTLLALPLTAVLALRVHSPAQMGLLGAAESAPVFLIGLFAGVGVDRWRRRPILIGADLGRAVLLGAVPCAAALGWLTMGHLYSVGFLVGVLAVFADLADQSLLPAVVGHAHLVEASSKQELSSAAVGILGPGLAGALVQALTAPLAIAADAVSFLVSAVCISLLRSPEARPPTRSSERRSLWGEIAEGLRAVLAHPLLRPMALSGGVLNFFSSALLAVYVLFAVTELRLSPLMLGALSMVRSGGFLAGALLTPWAGRRFGTGPTMVGGVVLMGAAWLPFGFVGGPPLLLLPVLAAMHLVSGVGNPLYTINASSLRQTITPDRLLGRMNASYRFIGRGVMPLGSLTGGALGTLIGLRPAVEVAALGLLVGALWLLLSPLPGLREMPPHVGDGAM